MKPKQPTRKKLRKPDHPNSNFGKIDEHVFKASCALGKPLPKGVEVHHMDSDVHNNKNCNLVICENHQYHFLLHQRIRALKACGNANWIKCQFCKKYDSPENLKFVKNKNKGYHIECKRKYDKSRYTPKQRRHSLSVFAGIHWNKNKRRWIARFYENNSEFHIGSFHSKIEAFIAREKFIHAQK